MAKFKLDYIWLDGYTPVPNLRTKNCIKEFDSFPTVEDLPLWGFDGSSTQQADGGDSDCILKPVAVYPDKTNELAALVMCEVMLPNGDPHPSNSRATIADDPGTWFGFEQEYFLVEDGRPYGGIIVWTPHLHSYNGEFSNRYWLSLGAVGPISGAEEVQELIHKIIDVPTAKGWDNQLENEFVFALGNERLYRLKVGEFSNSWEYDFIGMSELLAGTLRSEIGGGAGFRFGRNLQQSFPAASLIPGRNINPLSASLSHQWHAFINLYARYVFNDITLDGNYRHDSHSVTLTNGQAFISIGGSFHYERWGAVVSVQDSTRTFEERSENTLFASFSVTYRW